MGIEVKNRLPEGNTSLLQQVVVGHVAPRLLPQNGMYQPLVAMHQGLQAGPAP